MSYFGSVTPQVVLLFGAPGAGKGTVGSMLCKVGNHYHLSSGDIFRNLDPTSESGKIFHSFASKGELVPDDITLRICTEYIKELIDTNKFNPSEQFLFLDGLPRTLTQAKILDETINVRHIIALEVENEDEIVRRLSLRAEIEGRKDDANVDIIKNRIKEYRAKTVAVLENYPAELVKKYRGDLTQIEVLRDVLVGSADILKSV